MYYTTIGAIIQATLGAQEYATSKEINLHIVQNRLEILLKAV